MTNNNPNSKEHMYILIEDWKMAKDRIDNFDKAILSIRLTGIPIVLLIIGIGIAIIDKTKEITVPILNCNGAVIPFIIAVFYTLSLFLLDLVHYLLLLKAVYHAIDIEKSKEFNNLLLISHKLTSKNLTFMHTLSMIFLYGTIFILSISLVILFWNGVNSSVEQSTSNLLTGLIS